MERREKRVGCGQPDPAAARLALQPCRSINVAIPIPEPRHMLMTA
jgi:hypothetical protein